MNILKRKVAGIFRVGRYYSVHSSSAEAQQKRKLELETFLRSRFFYVPAFEIYGGVKGLYDYGPPGCAVLQNILTLWREWFVLEENMLQMHTACLTPEHVFQASGHVAKFQDYMVRDTETGECYRADHLVEVSVGRIEDLLAKLPASSDSDHERARLSDMQRTLPGYSLAQLADALHVLDVRAPETGNAISAPFPFNLMFQTQIGPSGKYLGLSSDSLLTRSYLRPETAQGLFVNFARLLEYSGGRLPFAAAQIGPAYRNEISPRAGLMRVREFTLAEIEHFVNPENKQHEKYCTIADVVIPFLLASKKQRHSEHEQQILRLKISDAVNQGIVANETLAYYIARTYLFLLRLGIDESRIRFREHQANERAHYAIGCFDAEIHSSHGWVECCGIADRSCYDLTSHQKASGKNLGAFESYPDGPVTVEVDNVVPNKALIGKVFKEKASQVFRLIEELGQDEDRVAALKIDLAKETGNIQIGEFSIPKEMIKIAREKRKISGVNFIPSVIEPSFGIGRILYSLLDQAYHVRPNDTQRVLLKLKPRVAPFTASILPLVSKDELVKKTYEIESLLKRHLITSKVDITGVSIGRRYARTDELGIPFGLTVDFTTVADDTVTLRERDSTEQVRIPIAECARLLAQIVGDETTWDDVKTRFPLQHVPVNDVQE